MADPYFSSVVLLAVNDSKGNGTTAFADQSSSAKTITTNGNAQYSTATAPTGLSSSGLFDGTADYLSLLDSNDWTLSADFTVECFLNTTQGTQFAALMSQNASGAFGVGQWAVLMNSAANDGKLQFWQGDFSIAAALITGGSSARNGAWRHVAVTRSGDNWNIWLDGSSDAAVTQAVTWSNAAQPFLIGRQNGIAARDYNGSLAAVRITKGVARYTGAFTPPALPFSTSASTFPAPFLRAMVVH